MTAGYSDLRRWNGAKVGSAGDCIRRGVRRLERAAETMGEQSFPTGWEGRGATAAAITRNRLVHFLQIQARIRTVFAGKLIAAEATVSRIERDITTLDEEALSHEFRIADDGSITDEHDYGSFSPDDLVTWVQRRIKFNDLVDKRDTLVADAAAVDAELTAAVAEAMDNTDPAEGIALPGQEVQDEWAGMTDAERQEVLRNIAAELAGEYGVTTYSINFGPLPPGTIGQHDPATHAITINTAYLDDPIVLNAIVHEMMHAGHDAGLDGFPGLSPQDIEELRDNEDNYRSGYGDPEDYRYQPEEDITRREADEWVTGLTPDELDEYR